MSKIPANIKSIALVVAFSAVSSSSIPDVPVNRDDMSVVYSQEVERFKQGLNAATLARVAEVAQGRREDPRRAVIERAAVDMPEFTDIEIVQSGGMTVVIAGNPVKGEVFLSFDPTKENQFELATNLNIIPTWHSFGGRVPSGYYNDMIRVDKKFGDHKNSINALKQKVTELFIQYDQAITVYLAGMSKGGSKASLAAAKLHDIGLFDDAEKIELGGVYTYGAPASGSSLFAKIFNKSLGDKTWNVLFEEDDFSKAYSWFYNRPGQVVKLNHEGCRKNTDRIHSVNSYRNCLNDSSSYKFEVVTADYDLNHEDSIKDPRPT